MAQQPELIRGLTLRDTTALVVGTIIGSGIFLKTGKMAAGLGSPTLVLLAWFFAGILSLAGALAYAELGAMMPKAGGEYVFLRTAYGDLAAFLFGWMRIIVGSTGSVASFGVGFSIFIATFLPAEWIEPWTLKTFKFLGDTINWQFGPQQLIAVGIIVFFSAVACLRVVLGGRVQSVLTAGKILGILIIVFGVFFFADSASWDHLKTPANAKTFTGVGAFTAAFAAAMMAALWAYDGWNNMPMMAGEVKNPGRNVPLALILGMAIVLVIYGAVNVAYFYALPFDAVAGASSNFQGTPVVIVASKTFLGEYGPKFVCIAVLLSIVGVLNGSILTSARIPYAMAKDGLFFKKFATLNHNSVPVRAILMQGSWACVLALSGTFDQLTDCVVFAGMIFYGACCLAVVILRHKRPDLARPYKTLGYPVVPLLFVAAAIWLLVASIKANPVFCGAGLVLIAMGLPIYYYLRSRPGFVPPARLETELVAETEKV